MDAYRALFQTHLEQCGIDDIRLALNQNQPLGNSRFYSKIARMTGERRQARPRGRPRSEKAPEPDKGQGDLGF
jgi:putative transposase